MNPQEFNDALHQVVHDAMEAGLDRRQIMQVMAYQTFSMVLAHAMTTSAKNMNLVQKIMSEMEEQHKEQTTTE